MANNWEPIKPPTPPAAPNPEAVARGLQSAINAAEVKAKRGRTGFDIASDWDVIRTKVAVAGTTGLYESTVNSLTGASGVGKSLMMLSIAAEACRAGTPVVILATEHAVAWHERLAVWCGVYNGGVALGNFHIVGEEGSRAAVADPESFLYELQRRRLAGALVVLDTVGASGVDMQSTESAKAFMARCQAVADGNETCFVFLNHEYVNGKAGGNVALHNNIGNRFRCGVLSDGTREITLDRDRYSTTGTMEPVRYRLAKDTRGREYLVRLGSDMMPESLLRSEILACMAERDYPMTDRQIARSLGLTCAMLAPEIGALVALGTVTLNVEGQYALG